MGKSGQLNGISHSKANSFWDAHLQRAGKENLVRVPQLIRLFCSCYTYCGDEVNVSLRQEGNSFICQG